MKWVHLQSRPLRWPTRSPAPLLDAQATRAFTSQLSVQECTIIAAIVDCELRRRGFWRVRAGGRYYCAAEERVIADVVAFGLDLGEIGAQMEEAQWETG